MATFGSGLTINKNGQQLTFSNGGDVDALITGSGAFAKGGGGTLFLNNSANSFSNSIDLNQGTIVATTLKANGTNSSLGTGTSITMTAAVLNDTTTLRYDGTGGVNGSTNRTINLGGTNSFTAALEQNGTGHLTYSGNISSTTNSAKTLNLSGSTSGTAEISGNVTSGTNVVSLTKSGTGQWTLSGAGNSYTGTTAVNGGTLNITGSKSSGVGAVAVGGSAASGTPRLAGSGTVNGAVTIKSAGGGTAGILNAGNATLSNKVGSMTMGGSLAFEGGSTFEWDLGASKDANGAGGNDGVAGTDFDSVSVTGNITVASGSIFKVIFGSTVLSDITTGNAFWNTPYGTQTWNMSAIFGEAFASGGFTDVQTSADVSAYGSFSISDSTLTWTAIPEPTSSLAGLLLTGGLLRRRRKIEG